MGMIVRAWAWGGCVLGRWLAGALGRGGWRRISGIAAFRYTMINQFRCGSHTGGAVATTEASVHLHAGTQISIVPQYQRACSALCTVAVGVRGNLIQPVSNRDQEHQKYYTLQQLAPGGHPQPCSTIRDGQVQKKQWT